MTMDEASGLACKLADLRLDESTDPAGDINMVLDVWKRRHDGYRREDAARIFAWLAYQRRGIDT